MEPLNYGLKNCPFCNAENTDVGFFNHTQDCYLMRKYMNANKDDLISAWETRPLEEHLQNELNQTKYFLTLANEELNDLATLNAILEEEKSQTCDWHYDDDGGYCDSWNGTCGIMWAFGEDGPVENEVNFCPKCGKRINIINEESDSNEETEEESE